MNLIKLHKCPICNKLEPAGKYKPFCSKRCSEVDLGNWFSGTYSIPIVEMDEKDLEDISKREEEGE